MNHKKKEAVVSCLKHWDEMIEWAEKQDPDEIIVPYTNLGPGRKITIFKSLEMHKDIDQEWWMHASRFMKFIGLLSKISCDASVGIDIPIKDLEFVKMRKGEEIFTKKHTPIRRKELT